MKRSGFSAALLSGVLLPGVSLGCMFLEGGVAVWPMAADAQAASSSASAGCGAGGYRVVATRWDAVLGRGWELRQDCAHPDWPARSVAVSRQAIASGAQSGPAGTGAIAPPVQPFLVHAGERVRLWSQDEMVRIEMSGVAEQSARSGESVMVQIARQNDGAGMTVETLSGIVRGPGDVEMEP